MRVQPWRRWWPAVAVLVSAGACASCSSESWAQGRAPRRPAAQEPGASYNFSDERVWVHDYPPDRHEINATVIASIERRLPDVRQCFVSAGGAGGDGLPALDGAVEVRFQLRPDGAVAQAELVSNVATPAAGECILTALRGWQLAAFDAPGPVWGRYTFTANLEHATALMNARREGP